MAKNPLLISLFVFLSISAFAQLSTPVEVVQRQLKTYNNRDLEGFMYLFSEDVALYNQADSKLLAEGKDQVEALYANLFEKSPKLYSHLTNRMVLGNTVIDHENITGRMGDDNPIELIVIYELKDLKIAKVTVIR